MTSPTSAGHVKAFKGVLFDLDGTLVDTVPAMVATFNAVVAPLIGRPIPRQEVISRLGPPAVEIMRIYDPEHADSLIETYLEHYLAVHVDHAQLYPGVACVLAELTRCGVALGVVTSKRRRSAIPTLVHFGLAERFQVVVTEDDVTEMKPSPEPVRAAVKALGLLPSEVLVVGDNPTDMEAARTAGCTVGAAVWGYYGRAAAEQADWVFEQLADVLSVACRIKESK